MINIKGRIKKGHVYRTHRWRWEGGCRYGIHGIVAQAQVPKYELMAANNVEVLPVTVGGRFAGILSYRDVISCYKRHTDDNNTANTHIILKRQRMKMMVRGKNAMRKEDLRRSWARKKPCINYRALEINFLYVGVTGFEPVTLCL